jgi:DNA polymerase I
MSRIKECFTTRFPAGYIVNADFSQLEVVGLAILSLDPRLIQDLRDGLDMHVVRAAKLFNIEESAVSKAQRQTAKQLSFQLSYGAGAKSMADKNNVELSVAKKFIEVYYERYKRVKEWQDDVAQSVKRTRYIDGHTKLGYPRGNGTFESPAGRRYCFKEYDAMGGWQKDASFSPTEMKNYPVQGFSADVMSVYRSAVMRELVHTMFTDTLFINSVHDSVMFDCRNKESVDKVVEVLYNTCKELPTFLKKRWNIRVPVEFKIDVEAGVSWGSLYKLKGETNGR